MNCREAGNALSPYLDGELDARRRGQLEQHVAGCARCAAELTLQRRAVQLLAAPKTMAQPEGLLAEFKQRLAAETPAPRRTWRSAPWSWSLAGFAATAAAVALVVSLQTGRSTVAPQNSFRQVAQLPKELDLPAGTAGVANGRTLRPSAPGVPIPERAPGTRSEVEFRRDAPAMAGPSAKSVPPTSSSHAAVPEPSGAPPTHATPHAGREVTTDADVAALADLDTRGGERKARQPAPASPPAPQPAPFVARQKTNLPFLADKGRSRELALRPTDPRKAEVQLREQEAAVAGPPALSTAAPAPSAAEAGNRSTPRDTKSGRRAEGMTTKAASAVPPSAPAGASPAPAPNAERLEVTVHRPSPDPLDRTAAGGGGFASGQGVGLRGGAGGAGPPTGPSGPPGPQGTPGRAAGALAAAAPSVAPEIAAAMRAPVDVKLSNVTLLGLTDRLAAEAAVPIVVEDPIVRQLRVTADLNAVPLYRALETVATQANLVIVPRPGGITLQVRDAAQGSPAEIEKQTDTQRVWSPAWGTLPRTGFAATPGRSSDAAARNRQLAGGRVATGTNVRNNARTGNGTLNKEAIPAQRRLYAADEALAQQNQQTLQRAANQLEALNAPPVLPACPHCRRPLAPAQTYLCPKCKRSVKSSDLKCPGCGEPTPARCPHCRQPLAAPTKGPVAR